MPRLPSAAIPRRTICTLATSFPTATQPPRQLLRSAGIGISAIAGTP